MLKAVARQRLAAVQSETGLGIAGPDPTAARGAPLPTGALSGWWYRHDFVTIELVYEPGALGSAFGVLGDAGWSTGSS